MKKYYLIGLAILSAAFIGGCILSGTVTFTYELDRSIISDNVTDTLDVDLTTESDYNDNKDKIKSIDAITVVGWVKNNDDDTNSVQIFMYDETDPDPAVRIFSSPRIAGHDSLLIDWADGLSHIENFDALKAQLQDDGIFHLYGTAESSPFNMDFAATLVITFTVGN